MVFTQLDGGGVFHCETSSKDPTGVPIERIRWKHAGRDLLRTRTPTSSTIGVQPVSYRENTQSPRKRERCRVSCTLVGMAIEIRSMASGFVPKAFIK